MTIHDPRYSDVIIIGGGATGAGIARDCALRGLSVTLLERHDIATGATGRNHGLLHSGARYAVTDGESARECIAENQILKRIARHCIEPTDGLFITLPEDDLAFQETFITACNAAGIQAEAMDPARARQLEPSVNPTLIGAVKVPDGTVDPFRLTAANMLDAREHGARILTGHEVTGLIREGHRVCGVRVFDTQYHEHSELFASVIINAGGIWGQRIAEYADLSVRMFPAKGSLLILDHRINNHVINRCRKPSDADILVPGDTISLIGTTSTHVDYSDIDYNRVTAEEVDILLRVGEKLAAQRNRIADDARDVLPWMLRPQHMRARSPDQGQYEQQSDHCPYENELDGRIGEALRLDQRRHAARHQNHVGQQPGHRLAIRGPARSAVVCRCVAVRLAGQDWPSV